MPRRGSLLAISTRAFRSRSSSMLSTALTDRHRKRRPLLDSLIVQFQLLQVDFRVSQLHSAWIVANPEVILFSSYFRVDGDSTGTWELALENLQDERIKEIRGCLQEQPRHSEHTHEILLR